MVSVLSLANDKTKTLKFIKFLFAIAIFGKFFARYAATGLPFCPNIQPFFCCALGVHLTKSGSIGSAFVCLCVFFSTFCACGGLAARAVLVRASLFLGGVSRVVFPCCWSCLALVVVGFPVGGGRLLAVPVPCLAGRRGCPLSAVRRLGGSPSGVVRSVPSSRLLGGSRLPRVGGSRLGCRSCGFSVCRAGFLVRRGCPSCGCLPSFGRGSVLLGVAGFSRRACRLTAAREKKTQTKENAK